MNFEKNLSPNPFEQHDKEEYSVGDVENFLTNELEKFNKAGDDERFQSMVKKLEEALGGLKERNNVYAINLLEESIRRNEERLKKTDHPSSIEEGTDRQARIDTENENKKFQKMKQALLMGK